MALFGRFTPLNSTEECQWNHAARLGGCRASKRCLYLSRQVLTTPPSLVELSDVICFVLQRFVRNNSLFASTFFKAILYHPDESQLLTSGTDRKVGQRLATFFAFLPFVFFRKAGPLRVVRTADSND